MFLMQHKIGADEFRSAAGRPALQYRFQRLYSEIPASGASGMPNSAIGRSGTQVPSVGRQVEGAGMRKRERY